MGKGLDKEHTFAFRVDRHVFGVLGYGSLSSRPVSLGSTHGGSWPGSDDPKVIVLGVH